MIAEKIIPTLDLYPESEDGGHPGMFTLLKDTVGPTDQWMRVIVILQFTQIYIYD